MLKSYKNPSNFTKLKSCQKMSNFAIIKSCQSTSMVYINMVKTEETLRFEENLEKNSQKPDKIQEKKITLSHLRSNPSNLSRNMFKTAKI